jgi:RimJ/RimL family protein N-acetyltransferase
MPVSDTEQPNDLRPPVGPDVLDWSPPGFPDHVPLEGRYCRLVPLAAQQHATALFAAFAADDQGRNWTYLPYGPFSEFEAFSHWLKSIAAAEDPQFYTVIPDDTGKPGGLTSFLRIDPRNGSIEVGHIHFAEAIKRSPVTTEAMFLMMKKVFELGYRRYEWKCDAPQRTVPLSRATARHVV